MTAFAAEAKSWRPDDGLARPAVGVWRSRLAFRNLCRDNAAGVAVETGKWVETAKAGENGA
jgi:hypothetical protein